jgi:equilibrative nucleoside transporter 1/2/3
VLAAAALQAAAGSFLQTAVTAEAALFGPSAMQALMSGQAAVGVAVSAVQLLSAYGSVRGALPSPSADGTVVVESAEDDGSAAASARAFFALSTVFLLATVGAHAWLVRLPAYASLTDTSRGVREDPDEHVVSSKDQRSQIMRVARANWVYEVAVALVFTVTLVQRPTLFTFCHAHTSHRQSSLQSPSL